MGSGSLWPLVLYLGLAVPVLLLVWLRLQPAPVVSVIQTMVARSFT